MGVIQYGALGLGTSAVLAVLAVGIVVIFRGVGVINLAQGSYAMLGAYLDWDFGQHGWPEAAAIPATVTAVAIIGLLNDQLILRRLRSASPLARLIATIGMLLAIQAVVAMVWGVVPQTTPAILPSVPLRLGGVVLPSDRLWLLLLATGITAVITVVWRATRLGWIAEAVSENQRLAASLGWSPEVVSGGTWMVGTGLAALAGIFIAPITELDTTTMALLVIPALAAALVGSMRSFPLTLVGAVVIGVAQSEVDRFVKLDGASDAVPLVAIIVMLLVRGSVLPLRGHMSDRLPRVGTGRVRWRFALPAILGVSIGLAFVSSLDWIAALVSTFGVAIIMTSFVVLIGYAGQVSLAQYAVAGFGVLFATQVFTRAGLPFLAALIVGALGAGVVSAVIAIPTLRTRGVQLAILTFALATVAQTLIFDSPVFGSGAPVWPPKLFGWSIDPVAHPQRYMIFAFLVMVLVALGIARLRRSSVGRMLLAVRDNERAAASNGIDIVAAKLLAFAIAGAIAGLGGIVLAFQSSTMSFGYYDPNDPIGGLTWLAVTVIGGIGFIGGPLLGSVLTAVSIGSVIALRWQAIDYYIPLLSGLGVLAVLVLYPSGCAYGVGAFLVRRGWLTPGQRLPAIGRETTGVGLDARTPLAMKVRGLTVRYGRTVAVAAVDLDLRPREVLGLIGPNGAGKTSLIDAITGFAATAGGSVDLNGLNITGWAPHRQARVGVTRSFQNLELYLDLTVRENMLTAIDDHRATHWLRGAVAQPTEQAPSSAMRVSAISHSFALDDYLDCLPENLPYGKRRLLAIARTVAAGASVLLLDEPVAGLDAEESAGFAQVVRGLASKHGMTVVVIEHDMDFVMAVCDRIVVMDFGRKIAEGSPQAVRQNPAAIAAYLGDAEPEAKLLSDEPIAEDVKARPSGTRAGDGSA